MAALRGSERVDVPPPQWLVGGHDCVVDAGEESSDLAGVEAPIAGEHVDPAVDPDQRSVHRHQDPSVGAAQHVG